MYAKNLPVPPKFDYPYQQQQKYSGSFIVASTSAKPKGLSADVLKEIEKTARAIEAAKRE